MESTYIQCRFCTLYNYSLISRGQNWRTTFIPRVSRTSFQYHSCTVPKIAWKDRSFRIFLPGSIYQPALQWASSILHQLLTMHTWSLQLSHTFFLKVNNKVTFLCRLIFWNTKTCFTLFLPIRNKSLFSSAISHLESVLNSRHLRNMNFLPSAAALPCLRSALGEQRWCLSEEGNLTKTAYATVLASCSLVFYWH